MTVGRTFGTRKFFLGALFRSWDSATNRAATRTGQPERWVPASHHRLALSQKALGSEQAIEHDSSRLLCRALFRLATNAWDRQSFCGSSDDSTPPALASDQAI